MDKAIHSLGYRMGYALPNASLPNPIDLMLVFTQQVFPLDYIIMSAITIFFFFCSMSGVKNMGIWFLWLRVSEFISSRFLWLAWPCTVWLETC